MRPLFIGGTGRCGTTILRDTLGRHPAVAALPMELRFVVDTNGVVDLFEALTRRWGPYHADAAIYQFEQLMMEMTSDERGRYSGHQIDEVVGQHYFTAVRDLVDSLYHYETDGFWTGSYENRSSIYETELVHPHELREHFKSFFYQIFSRVSPGASWWVDDTPYSILQAEYLERIFPDAKLIHIYRHPLDVLASYNRIRTSSRRWTSSSTETNARRIRAIYEKWWQAQERTGLPILEVQFEQMVQSPEAVFGGICDFLEVDKPPDLVGGRIDQDKAHVGRRSYDQQGLSGEEISKVRAILNPAMRRYGYSV